MSTWIVQVAVVVLFALACGMLAVAWIRGRLGVAAIALFVIAAITWVVVLAAIAGEYGDANSFATCDENCSSVHYVSAVAFVSPPLFIALAALAMLVARGSRWRLRRTAARENQG
jgi:hypothetical protein